CQLIFDSRHVARIDELSRPEWNSFAGDLFTAQQAVSRVVKPDHINVESLGNVVPHLHWHIIPRYVGDPMWGAPVWRVPLDSMPDHRLPDDERATLLAQLQKALAGPLTDMTGVGLTSRWVAANRALETEHAAPLYRDPYARELAGDAGFDVLYSMRTVAGMGTFNGPDPFLTIRTRFFDDALLNVVRDSSIDQVVILAAGMDARAFRLEWPRKVRLFEVDREDVFTHKEAVLSRLKAKPSCDRRIVQHDLAQPWAAALVGAGFDPHQKTAFLAEGLLYYLDEAAVASMLDALRSVSAPGSWLGLDVTNPEVLTSPFLATYLNKLTELGSPWKFGVADPEAYLAAKGWQGSVVFPGEPEASYGRWVMPVVPRAIPGLPRTFLIRATRTAGS
ncbi:MAG TPA: SAM-dependent methyltransferase, partial [Vicinamibacterales bacterium]|nr:SAM-dependent methyltransferase [Vicinamibacterales bacterium]